jgi:hypothetical protein
VFIAVVEGDHVKKGESIVEVTDNEIGGPVRLVGNSTGDVPIVLGGNTIAGVLTCQSNEPAPTDDGNPNTVTGPQQGQCRNL